MNFLTKNSLIVSKKIKQIILRDILKSPVINYFGDTHQRNVLVSYITKPFRKGIDITHTNSAEALEIAKIFHSLNFNVDIADYDYEGYLDYDKYDVIFGFGEPLEKSFYKRNRKVVTIFYGTGMHINVQNINTSKRLRDVYGKKSKWLLYSARIVEKTWTVQTSSSDAVIVLGNETSKESFYEFFTGDIYSLIPSFFKIYDYKKIIAEKDFYSAKRNYLWFGGNGFIHRGLDVVLELFKENKHLNLHICGPIDSEPGFKSAFFNELYNTPNIKTYGFVRLDSKIFEELITKCVFAIYPTCAEGGGVAVLNLCGNGGLIPIVTKEATVDVNDFGLLIDSIDYYSIKDSLNKSQNLSEAEIKARSEISGGKISLYSLDNYIKQMREYLKLILAKHELYNG